MPVDQNFKDKKLERPLAIGNDLFPDMSGSYYVDKSLLAKDIIDSTTKVILFTRPRRFGKTLNMSMLECFFSVKYKNRADLFDGLEVWEDEDLRAEQGAWPVIFLSFANVKQTTWSETRKIINEKLVYVKDLIRNMMDEPMFSEDDREAFRMIRRDMEDATASSSLYNLCSWLERYYGKKVLIFLDEYDTPMQEAWMSGYWDEMVSYFRNLFNSTFKTNPSLGRAILTGITRVSKESIFSDINNLKVVTTSSWKYETAFGFTEKEVFDAMDVQGCTEKEKQDVKEWYDGFTFGRTTDIYNPWSVTNYLDEKRLKTWWANTSGNGLIGRMLRRGNPVIKQQFESLLKGETLTLPVNEEIVFNQLDEEPFAIWSLMLASGYLKVIPPRTDVTMHESDRMMTLAVTNRETLETLEGMVKSWFGSSGDMSPFLRTMLQGDVKTMGRYLNRIMQDTISYFDSGKQPSQREPENFYHGLVLGLIAEKAGDYRILSNRESGFGRYDVVMEPLNHTEPAVILEFKVFDKEDGEETLEDTAANALRQIEDKRYDRDLLNIGISSENIRKYGIAFEGKNCIVRKART